MFGVCSIVFASYVLGASETRDKAVRYTLMLAQTQVYPLIPSREVPVTWQVIEVFRGANFIYKVGPGVAGELWREASGNRVAYQTVYPRHGLIIEFDPVDLPAMRQAAIPVGLNLIDPQWLRLPQTGRRPTAVDTLSEPAMCRAGDSPPAFEVKLCWLEGPGLPYSASWRRGHYQFDLSLTGVAPVDFEPYRKQFDRFERIDFADIGDNEAHAGLRKISPPRALSVNYYHSHEDH